MTTFALLFTLAAIGISETAYLIRKRIALVKPVCILGENCGLVLESKYSKLFLVPNDLLGLLFYIVVSLAAALLVIGMEPINLFGVALKTLVGIGASLSVIFTYFQWRVIRIWCFWCLMSAFTIWLMGVIILVSK